MNRTKYLIAGALAALVVGGSTAGASHLIRTANIAKGAVTLNRLSPAVQKMVKHAGSNGVNGKDGLGFSGANGSNGAKGDNGAPGVDGKSGSNGAKGDAGAQGAKGLTGADGTNGTNGSNGAQGTAGANGHDGANGAPGAAGAPGAPGHDAFGSFSYPNSSSEDSSVCGGNWAVDTYDRYYQVDPQTDGSFLVTRTDINGSFVSLAGDSPNDAACGDPAGNIPAGITGDFYGYAVLRVTGGNYNPEGVCAAGCTTAQFFAAKFPDGSWDFTNAWEYHYLAGSHGAWRNADVSRLGNAGNIIP